MAQKGHDRVGTTGPGRAATHDKTVLAAAAPHTRLERGVYATRTRVRQRRFATHDRGALSPMTEALCRPQQRSSVAHDKAEGGL